MISVLILLRIVLSSLTVYARYVEPQADFNVIMMEGKWYDIGFACDYPVIASQIPSMQMGIYNMTPGENGDLSWNYERFVVNSDCLRYNNVGKKGSKPGIFNYQNLGYENTLTFTDVKAEYAIMYLYMSQGSDNGEITKLIARTKNASDEAISKWKDFTASLGISPQNTALLPKSEGCVA